MNYDTMDPAKQVRSDLWPSMTLTQLTQQQEIVIDRINKLTSIMGIGYTESLRTMYGALQQANQDLARLIDHRSQKEK